MMCLASGNPIGSKPSQGGTAESATCRKTLLKYQLHRELFDHAYAYQQYYYWERMLNSSGWQGQSVREVLL